MSLKILYLFFRKFLPPSELSTQKGRPLSWPGGLLRNVIALFYFVGSENPCIYSVPNRKQSYDYTIKIFSCKGYTMCKNNLYRTNRHSCYLLEYHLVVVTKYRHPVLKGAIKVYLLDQTKTIFDSWHCTIKAVNTDLDHIHILFEAPPQVQLSKLANNYKTVTSRLIRKNFSEQLKQYYWKPYFWSDSYFVCSVSDRTESAVKSYIDSQ